MRLLSYHRRSIVEDDGEQTDYQQATVAVNLFLWALEVG